VNSIKRKEKISVALCQREKTELALQNEMNQTKKVINYLMQKFWDRFEIHNRVLVSFNGKIVVNNFPLHYIDEFEKIDDLFIELFNTPLLITNTELSNNEDIQSRLKLLTIVNTFSLPSHTSDDKCFLEYSHDTILSGSSSFKWLKGNSLSNQLMTLDYSLINYDIITSKEKKLKVIHTKSHINL
jgi:hypothetical protein